MTGQHMSAPTVVNVPTSLGVFIMDLFTMMPTARISATALAISS